MKEINITIAIISFLILAMGLIKANIKKSFVSEPLIALVFGIILGPHLLGIINPVTWEDHHEILHQFTRFTLALAVMSSALRLPSDYLKKNVRPYAVVLLGGMLIMLILSSLFYFIAGFDLWESVLLGAILAPTDPVLATAIVSSTFANEHIPLRLRNMITAESASNDGLAFAFVLLPIYMMEAHNLPFVEWITKVFLWQNVGAIIIGGLLGYAVGKAFTFFQKRKAMVTKTLMAVALSFTFFVLTFFSVIGLNGIIGVFAAGIAFQTQIQEEIEIKHEEVQSMMERIFIVPVFIILGAMIPWAAWSEMSVYIWIITPLIIFIRRIPALFALKSLIKIFTIKDTFFAGWFGPIGVAALFYITLIITKYPGHDELWPVVSYAVAASTFIHAVSANPLSEKLYTNSEFNKKLQEKRKKEKNDS